MTDTNTVFKQRDNVILRPVEKEDAKFLQAVVQHPDVRDTLGRPPLPVSEEQEKNYVEELSSDNDTAYFLIEYCGERAGVLSLHGLEDDYRRGEFGISIHPQYHGNGVGKKSVKMMTEYAFETLNLHKIRGGFLEGNKASKRVMEKSGFQEEGRERHYKYVNGEWKDVI